VDEAEAEGLRYVSDEGPGIRRNRAGRGFSYKDPAGETLRDSGEIERIRGLAVPPAWTDVWICPNPLGHIQATGRDAKGRKQYRYHPRWRSARDGDKFGRLATFGERLPSIRRRVARDLKRPGLPREKVLAAVVRLLDSTLIRVGNPEYARDNDSIGLTTMRDRHVDVFGSSLRFRYRGKSGKLHEVDHSDRRLAQVIKRCQDLPGQDLFQYVDSEGEPRSVGSADVNAYLREVSGQDFTSKDFRTWGGSMHAIRAFLALGDFATEAESKANVVEGVKRVAERLGNTPAVCRKSYIHPEVIDAYQDGSLLELADARASREGPRGLRSSEALLLETIRRSELSKSA
jgi:DNA topoisomerase-1